MSEKRTIVRARVPHPCEGIYPVTSCNTIKAGDLYLLVTEYPGPLAAYAETRPVRLKLCRECAGRFWPKPAAEEHTS